MQPALIERAQPLADALRARTPDELARLFKISARLAAQCHQWMQQWRKDPWPAEARQTIMLFYGDAYQSMRAWTLSRAALDRAQKRLRILSGLYGVLRPYDLIMPHRLPMGTRLSVEGFPDLYSYWHKPLNAHLAEEIRKSGDTEVLNLASQEYFQAIDPARLPARIVHVHFQQKTEQGPKTIGIVAKRARGAMARWLINEGVESIDEAKAFCEDGWRFDEARSKANEWFFVREAP